MEFSRLEIKGSYLISFNKFIDDRGVFVKTFTNSAIKANGLHFEFAESFYSISKKDVIRGMHFQIPPADHEKFIYCTKGLILDVLLDLRLGPDYGKYLAIKLSEEKPEGIFIPKGVAHGFLSLSDESLVFYNVSSEYSPVHDRGIHPLSFGFNWPVKNAILSNRDLNHPNLNDFESPFKEIK